MVTYPARTTMTLHVEYAGASPEMHTRIAQLSNLLRAELVDIEHFASLANVQGVDGTLTYSTGDTARIEGPF